MTGSDGLHDELQREMGCTLEEFLRWLPGATQHAPVIRQGGLYRVLADQGTVDITLEVLPERRIASIRLPVLRVHFRFIGMGQAQRVAFLEYFDRYTMRGGG